MSEQRTDKQNASLHLFFEHLATELNDSGMDVKKVIEFKTVDVPWSKELVKELLWKPIEQAMLGKESTTKLTTKEVGEVYEVLNRHLATKLGVSVPFPSYFNESGE